MAEIHLTEAEGKKYPKAKKELQGLLALLGEYEAIEEGLHAERLEKLKEIVKEVKELPAKCEKKKTPLSEEVTEYLEAVEKQAGVEKKRVEALERSAPEADEKDEEKEEVPDAEAEVDEDSIEPAVVKKRLTALLNRIRHPDPDKPPFAFMLAAAGGESRILLCRIAGSTQREQLKEMITGPNPPKFFKGICIWEEGLYTFVLETVPAGLSKKISKALLLETGTKYRVRVRSADGSVVTDSDVEPESFFADEAAPVTAPPPPPPPPPPDEARAAFARLLKAIKPDLEKVLAGQVPASGSARAKLDELVAFTKVPNFAAAVEHFPELQELVAKGLRQMAPPEEPAETFRHRLAAVLPRIKEAIAVGGPNAAELRLRASEAGTLAKQGNYDEAQAILDRMGELIDGKGEAPQEAPAAPTPSQKANLAEASIQWQRDRSFVQGEIDRLAAAMRSALQSEPDFGAIQAKIQEAETAFADWNERLTGLIDAAQAAAPAAQDEARGVARAGVEEYLGLVKGDAWYLRGLDANPFSPTDVRAYLGKSLPALVDALS